MKRVSKLLTPYFLYDIAPCQRYGGASLARQKNASLTTSSLSSVLCSGHRNRQPAFEGLPCVPTLALSWLGLPLSGEGR
jgi:hypothetical protein